MCFKAQEDKAGFLNHAHFSAMGLINAMLTQLSHNTAATSHIPANYLGVVIIRQTISDKNNPR